MITAIFTVITIAFFASLAIAAAVDVASLRSAA
jgi:hypothetical protein